MRKRQLRVHYNLQRCRVSSTPKHGEACWTLRDSRRVVGYRSRLLLSDVTFVVQPGGLRRVRAKKQRAVIAYAKGTQGCNVAGGRWQPLRFNPFRDTSFVAGRTPVSRARCVRFEGRKAHVLV
jgi:hypothetical protein